MKRNILLAFLLVGLVVLEWGCNCGGRTDYVVTKISNEIWTVDQPIIEAFDEFHYEEGVIEIKLKWDAVYNFRYNASSIYACQEHEFYYNTDLTSVIVVSSKPYLEDVANQISILSQRGSINDTLGAHFLQTRFASYAPFIVDNNLELVFNTPPLVRDTFQFTFQFFDTDGNIFETTTDPIIIMP